MSGTGTNAESNELLSSDDVRVREEKADKLGGMTQMLIWLGIVLHVTAIVLRGLKEAGI